MHPLARALKDLMALGLSGEALVAAVDRMEGAIYVERTVDPMAERRRAKDRDRKREAAKAEKEARIPQNSTESAEGAENAETPPLALSPSPQTPQPHTHTPPSITTRAKADGFERFWTAYPRKVGKPKALDCYGKAIKRLELRHCHDPPAEILGGLMRQLDGFSQREPELVPHATTWLNRDGWDDEADTPRNAQPRRANDQRPADQRQAAREDNNARAFAGSEASLRRRTFVDG